MVQYFFGTGSLYGRQTGVSNPTPVRFGAIQGCSVDVSYTTKELYGANQFPLDVARGQAKITGKANFAQLNGISFNNLFFGESSIGTTPILTAIDEAQTVANNTVTVTNAANYLEDLGVVNTTSGVSMNRVSAGNESGVASYSVNETTGVYTFNSAMDAVIVNVSYDYTGASGAGTSIVLSNQLVGSAPTFLIVLAGVFKSKAMRLKLNACVSSKLTLPTKLADYTINEFDFMAYADASGNVGTLSFAE